MYIYIGTTTSVTDTKHVISFGSSADPICLGKRLRTCAVFVKQQKQTNKYVRIDYNYVFFKPLIVLGGVVSTASGVCGQLSTASWGAAGSFRLQAKAVGSCSWLSNKYFVASLFNQDSSSKKEFSNYLCKFGRSILICWVFLANYGHIYIYIHMYIIIKQQMILKITYKKVRQMFINHF